METNAKTLYLFIVRYYTLSDGQTQQEVIATDYAEAEQIARKQDDTFDRIESIGSRGQVKKCPACNKLTFEEVIHCANCGTFL